MKNIFFSMFMILGYHAISQTISIPDANFKSLLLNGSNTYDEFGSQIYIDINQDEEIQISEALNVYFIDIANINNSLDIVSDVTGVEGFTNLKYLNLVNHNLTNLDVSSLTHLLYLWCGGNNLETLNINGLVDLVSLSANSNNLQSIDFSTNPLLEYITIYSNNIASLDITNQNNLIKLECGYNNLSTLDVSNHSFLTTLTCNNNSISELNIEGSTNMIKFDCSDNLLTSLELAGYDALEEVSCYSNKITSLILSCTNLKYLHCSANNLSSLDISQCPGLNGLMTSNNLLLEYINLKNGSPLSFLEIYNNPNLNFVCVDENENPQDINNINQLYPNCVISTTCSLSNNNYDLAQNINLYPNPASTQLNIETNDSVLIKTVSIYTILGQEAISISNLDTTLRFDISGLVPGTYILRFITDKGTLHSKFIKQ